MRIAELLPVKRLLRSRHRRLLLMAAAGVLAIAVETAAAVVIINVSAQNQAQAEVEAAQLVEQEIAQLYTEALPDLQPLGDRLVDDALAWAESGSSLLTADDIAALQDLADEVRESLGRTSEDTATGAELKALFAAQQAMIDDARERFADYVASVIAAANAHIDAASLADDASRQAVVDAVAALEAAARTYSSIEEQFSALVAATTALDAAQAAAVEAAEAAAAASRGGRSGSGSVSCGPSNAVYVAEVLSLVNVERANVGLGPLAASGSLNSTAGAHATCMAANNSFQHSSYPGGWSAWGENIAQGYGSASSVVAAWMGSSGHRANILNPTYTHMGLGYVASGNWWCQQFGA